MPCKNDITNSSVQKELSQDKNLLSESERYFWRHYFGKVKAFWGFV